MGFSRKICTPLLRWGYRFFWSLPPWISSQIYRDPTGNPYFFLNFWCTPWNSNDSCSTPPPWNFPLISSTGGYNYFLKSPLHLRKIKCIFLLNTQFFLTIKMFFLIYPWKMFRRVDDDDAISWKALLRINFLLWFVFLIL